MRLLISIATLFFGIHCLGQQTLASELIAWKSPVIEIHTISNSTQACTLLMRPDSIRAYRTDANGALLYLFGIPRKVNEDLLGGFFKQDDFFLFLDNGYDKGIHSFEYNASTRQVVEHSIPFEIKNEYIIQRLSTEHYFVYLTLDKKVAEFVLYQFAEGKDAIVHRFPTHDNIREELSQDEKGPFAKTIMDVEKTTMAGECDFMVAKCRKKVYVQHDSLLLITNRLNGQSNIYTFDLRNYTLNQRVITHQTNNTQAAHESSNSFLLRNKLYYAAADKDSLYLQVCDFNSGNVLKQFTELKKDEISFMNNSASEKGGTIEGKKGKLREAAFFLKHPNRKRIVIAATPDDSNNEVQLSIGTLELAQTYSGGGPIGFGGGFSPGYFTSNWVPGNRFKSRLDGTTAAHLPGTMPFSINEKIAAYTDKIKIPKQGENLVLINNQYHYIFFDKRERTLSVVVFN